MCLLAIAPWFIPVVFLTFMAAFMAAVIWFKQKRKAQRSADMQQLAQVLELAFHSRDLFGLSKQLKAFDLFKRERSPLRLGRGTRVTNVMRGQVDGTDVFLFDYSYMVNTGNSAKEVRQTVFFADDKTFQLPNFRLKPENWWHKVLAKTGVQKDIQFPEHPDFSGRYWVTGEIEELIRQKFNPELQHFLTARPPIHLEGSNYYLIGYKPGKVLNPDEARAFFERCCQLVKMLKEKEGTELLNLAELKKEEAPEPLEAPKIAQKA